MKKKGFTLIELLAVIIILAVVALIATPITLNIIDDVRKSAIERSAEGYYNAAEYVYGQMMLDSNKEDIIFTFENGVQISSNPKYTLELKGEKAKGGMVYLSRDGHITVSINDGKYCVNVNNQKQTSLFTDMDNCYGEITQIPEKCFYVQNVPLMNEAWNLNGSEDWMNENYNTLYYHYDDAECPTAFDTLVIPSEVGGEQVEVVNYDTFVFDVNDFTVNNVIISNGVKFLMDGAFSDFETFHLSIKNVILPDGLFYIGEAAFFDNQLTNIEIPSSVKIIENAGNGNQGAFANNQLTSVTIGNSVTSIGSYAFQNNQLNSVAIPNSVTSIGSYAFKNNQLPDDQAFIYARNADGTVNNTYLIGYGGAKKDNVVIPNTVTSIGDYAFANSQLTSVTIPSSVTSIGVQAFANNQLTSATIPASLKNIDELAFASNKLKNVLIEDGVTNIGYGAFADNQLTSVTIPSSVKSIDQNAFSDNNFPNASAIKIEGDATRFDSSWTSIGFPAKS